MASLLLDNPISWLNKHAEALTGFVTSSITTPTVIVNQFAVTAINAIIVAVVSGFVGAIIAHLTKKLITKLESKKHGKKR